MKLNFLAKGAHRDVFVDESRRYVFKFEYMGRKSAPREHWPDDRQPGKISNQLEKEIADDPSMSPLVLPALHEESVEVGGAKFHVSVLNFVSTLGEHLRKCGMGRRSQQLREHVESVVTDAAQLSVRIAAAGRTKREKLGL